jgi:putative ABC transport system ATP-binding protein
MLSLQNVRKLFRTDEVETTALNDININIAKGEFVSIMGPSGCGKSTLLNIIGLLDTFDGGAYHFLDHEVSKYRERQMSQLRKKSIGFIFQSFNLIDELSVFENVELPLLYQKVPTRERKKRVEQALEKMGIITRRDHMPQQLSGGQQQRVAVARAVVGQPALLLADEPTGNLDSSNGEEVMNLLTSLHNEGTTVVMVTHSQQHADYAQRIINMLDGKVLSENVLRVS